MFNSFCKGISIPVSHHPDTADTADTAQAPPHFSNRGFGGRENQDISRPQNLRPRRRQFSCKDCFNHLQSSSIIFNHLQSSSIIFNHLQSSSIIFNLQVKSTSTTSRYKCIVLLSSWLRKQPLYLEEISMRNLYEDCKGYVLRIHMIHLPSQPQLVPAWLTMARAKQWPNMQVGNKKKQANNTNMLYAGSQLILIPRSPFVGTRAWVYHASAKLQALRLLQDKRRWVQGWPPAYPWTPLSLFFHVVSVLLLMQYMCSVTIVWRCVPAFSMLRNSLAGWDTKFPRRSLANLDR